MHNMPNYRIWDDSDVEQVYALSQKHSDIKITRETLQRFVAGGFWAALSFVKQNCAAALIVDMRSELAQVVDLVVAEEYRRQGFAQQLIKKLIAQACVENCTQIALESRVDNLAAENLYTKLGFKKVGSCQNFYKIEHEYKDAYLWSYYLNSEAN